MLLRISKFSFSGAIIWERDFNQPIVAMYLLQDDGLHKLHFTVMGGETMENLIKVPARLSFTRSFAALTIMRYNGNFIWWEICIRIKPRAVISSDPPSWFCWRPCRCVLLRQLTVWTLFTLTLLLLRTPENHPNLQDSERCSAKTNGKTYAKKWVTEFGQKLVQLRSSSPFGAERSLNNKVYSGCTEQCTCCRHTGRTDLAWRSDNGPLCNWLSRNVWFGIVRFLFMYLVILRVFFTIRDTEIS